GVARRADGEPIDHLFSIVSNGFHCLATNTGYVAAEMNASNGERIPTISPYLSARFLGRPWVALVESLGRVPSAQTRIERHALDDLIRETAGHVEAWLEHIGFTMEDVEPGLYFRIVRDDF